MIHIFYAINDVVIQLRQKMYCCFLFLKQLKVQSVNSIYCDLDAKSQSLARQKEKLPMPLLLLLLL